MKEVNLTEGSIFRKLIGFSIPMIAGNLLQQIYNLVDTLIVGKCIGPDALASVGSSKAFANATGTYGNDTGICGHCIYRNNICIFL